MNRMIPSAQLQRSAKSQRKALRGSQPAPLALEARLMFDGAALATERPVVQTADASGADAAVQPLDKGIAAVETKVDREGAAASADSAAIREIIFVDPSVSDWQQLISGKPQDALVIMLDPARDGLSQMADALKGQSGIDAIHVISHGSDGRLILGGKDVDQAALAEHQTDLQQIGQALSANGDILLYGCDIARGSAGAAFVDAVAKATSADVAASTDATGSAAKGGDWDLEYAAGQINVTPVIRAADVTAYDGLLANVTIDLDKNDSSGKTGFDYQATYDYREGRYPVCDSDVTIELAGGMTWEDVGGITIRIDNPKAGDQLDPNWAYNHKLRMSLSADGTEVTFRGGYQETSLADWYDSIKQVHFAVNTQEHSDRTIVFTIWESGWSGLRESKAYATIKVPVNTPASISPDSGGDYSLTEPGAGGVGDTLAGGKLTVNEPDAGQLGFRVPANLNGQYGTFTFNASTGAWGYNLDSAKSDALIAGQSVSDRLTVRSYDGTATHTITVAIAGSNDAPTITSGGSATVAENAASTTVVYTAVGSDPDAGDKISWSLSGTDAGKFNIGTDGKVTLKASADYETQNSYSFKVVATDKVGQATIKEVTLAVTNVNETPTITSGVTSTVAENAALNTVVYIATAIDPDAGDAVTWSLSGTDAGKFNIGTDGKVTLKASADYETQSSYSFKVEATDKSGLKASKDVTLSVTNVNETPTITSGNSASVLENSAASAVIYTATATDPDTGDTVAWSLTGTDAGKFAIGSDGKVTLRSSADYETQSSYRFNVVAADAGGLTSSKAITVSVTDVNEAPKPIADSKTVNEDFVPPSNAWTGNVLNNDSDPDRNTSLKVSQIEVNGTTYQLDQPYMRTNSRTLAINGVGTLLILANGNYDFTPVKDWNGSVPTITYTVTDGALTATSTLNITVTPVNDAAVIGGDTSRTVQETDAVLSAGGKLTVTDIDSPAEFKVQSNVTGSKGYGTFSLDAQGNWSYTTNTAHNEFVAGQTYTDSLTVEAADGTRSTISVKIDGTNDVAVISGAMIGTVTEDVNVSRLGNLVTSGKLSVTDLDAGQSEFRTNVTAQNGAWGDLTIDRNGNWTYWVANRDVQELKDGATHTDTFTVRALDGTTQQIRVTINGANDTPQISSGVLGAVWENSDVSTVVYTAKAADRDLGDTLNWSLAGADADAFTIGADGKVRLKVSANYEVKDYYTITVVATDALGARDSQNVIVLVGDADDPTVVTGDLAGNIDENGKKITGDLNASDEDGMANFFNANLDGKYGRFSMNADGTWTYTLDKALDRLAAGQTLTEKFTVYVHEHPFGMPQSREVVVTIVGTNDPAVITGDTEGRIVESDVAQSVGGKLSATDIDSIGKPIPKPMEIPDAEGLLKAKVVDGEPVGKPTFFVSGEQTGQYGTFQIAADGTWNYVMNGAHNEFEQGKIYTETFAARTADGTVQLVTVTIEGTSDVVPVTRETTAGGASTSGGGLFADTAGGSLRVAGLRGDLSGTRVPGQSDAPSGGPGVFNPEALLAQAPTAAGISGDLSAFERFDLMRVDASSDKDEWVVFIPAGGKARFSLPDEMFQGTQPADFVVLQSNGEPLPEWLAFNPATGQFVGVAPEQLHGTVRLQMTGRDAQGQDRVVRILLSVDLADTGSLAGKTSGELPMPAGKAVMFDGKSIVMGRPSFSEQLRASRPLPAAAAPAVMAQAQG